MQKSIVALLMFLSTLLGLSLQASYCRAANNPPTEGQVLPDFSLPVSQRQDERQYLGNKPEGYFKIPQIKAQVVIIEVFSMYCPICQKEAPVVNQLFDMIEERPKFKDKIKLVGIGAGNTPFEVNAFRNLYRIAFPLFQDKDFTLHNLLGQVRTPYFIVIKIKPDGTHKIIYSKVGSFGDPQQFLDHIIMKSELK